jgi:hypothetical protein
VSNTVHDTLSPHFVSMCDGYLINQIKSSTLLSPHLALISPLHTEIQRPETIGDTHTVFKDTMAEITDKSIHQAITERLGAVHVEVTDMSGTFTRDQSETYTCCLPRSGSFSYCVLELSRHTNEKDPRRLWFSIHNPHRLPSVPGPQLPQASSSRQRRPQGRDCCHPRLDSKVQDA